MKNHRLKTAIFLAAVSVLLAAPGEAQTPDGLSSLGINVSPAKFELAMPPGAGYNIPVTIQNGSVDMTHIQAYMVDFGLSESGHYKFEKPGSSPYSLMRWATINPREFDLPAAATQQVKVSLAVPKEQLNGEYSGIVFFQTRPVRHSRSVAFSIRIATKIYLTIPGTVKIAGAVEKMTASSGNGGETYRVLFKNTGNAHLYLNGSLEVRKGSEVVDRIALPANELVERGQDRLLEASGKALPAGTYDAIALVDYGGKTVSGGEIAFDKK